MSDPRATAVEQRFGLTPHRPYTVTVRYRRRVGPGASEWRQRTSRGAFYMGIKLGELVFMRGGGEGPSIYVDPDDLITAERETQ